MIVDARTHYDRLLARVYTWMAGPAAAARAAARRQLDELGIAAASGGGRAVDLGAGPGFHAAELVELGYRVWAVDTSRALLDELAAAVPEVHTVEGDLVDARRHLDGAFEVALCLGDTLPHLPDRAAVSAALASACSLLAPAGRIALAFRDYLGPAPGEVRHFLVRGDADRILACRLDYRDDHVVCTDLVLERDGATWLLHTSAYRKLRLDARTVAEELRARGLTVDVHALAGWVTVVGRRPDTD